MSRPYDWYANTVSEILRKPEYMGHTVNFRTFKKHYKDKRTRSDPKDWLIFENTHEAIVDAETWRLAQKLRKTVHRTDTIGEANPLTGLMYCADCGAKMYNHRSQNGNSWNDYYNCSVYTRSAHREKRACCSHSISTKVIRELLLATIRTVSAYAIENEAEFIRKVRAASQVQKEDHAKALKRKITKEKRRCTELDTLIKKLYESYATGKIPEKRFEMLSSEYEQEQTALEKNIAAEQAELEQFAKDSDRVEQFLALAKRYRDFTELTTPMIHEFVEKFQGTSE